MLRKLQLTQVLKYHFVHLDDCIGAYLWPYNKHMHELDLKKKKRLALVVVHNSFWGEKDYAFLLTVSTASA